jgi:hypothetical protein
MTLRYIAVVTAITLFAGGNSACAQTLASSTYILSGNVANSTATGGAICPLQGAALGGEVIYSTFKSKKPFFVVTIQHSGNIFGVIYNLASKFEGVENKKLDYVLVPAIKSYKGQFNLTPMSSSAFTLETNTGSLGGGSGGCDTTYSITIAPGVPPPFDQAF